METQTVAGWQAPSDRLVILASGTGSNAQAVIDACLSGVIHASVAAIVSDRSGARVLERAATHGIDHVTVRPEADESRGDYDARLASVVAGYNPDHVVLLGWMRILSRHFLERFPERVINLHPALPGELPGTRAIERALDEAREGRRTRTGVMVHLVPDERVDAGPVLTSMSVPVYAADTFESLSARMHAAEHAAIVATLASRCAKKETPG